MKKNRGSPGRAFGQKLDAMLKAMGLSRSDIYLTHLVKYRPALPGSLPITARLQTGR